MMNLYYMGKYDLNPESIPAKPHKPNCVKFKEPEDTKQFSIIVSIICLVIYVIAIIPVILIAGQNAHISILFGGLIFLIASVPREMMHVLCFKEDVYLFTNFRHGLLLLIGPEDMSKARFIFMSLLPDVLLGFIPYLIFLIKPELIILGGFAALNIAAGAGDYLNVFNAVLQMPKGSRTYMHHLNSYWYMPEE